VRWRPCLPWDRTAARRGRPRNVAGQVLLPASSYGPRSGNKARVPKPAAGLVVGMAMVSRDFGRARIDSEVWSQPELGIAGIAENTVRISRFGVTLYFLRENDTLDADGSAVAIRAAWGDRRRAVGGSGAARPAAACARGALGFPLRRVAGTGDWPGSRWRATTRAVRDTEVDEHSGTGKGSGGMWSAGGVTRSDPGARAPDTSKRAPVTSKRPWRSPMACGAGQLQSSPATSASPSKPPASSGGIARPSKLMPASVRTSPFSAMGYIATGVTR
jgi:hypothetical protein